MQSKSNRNAKMGAAAGRHFMTEAKQVVRADISGRLFAAALILLSLVLFAGTSFTTRNASAAASGGAVVDPALTDALAGASSVEVIVTFKGEAAPGASELALLSGLGITRGVTFSALPMAGVVATPAQVQALAARPEVRSLWLNRQLQYDNDGATGVTGVDRVRSDSSFTNRNGAPVTGRGVTVLVNDSGVDGTHPDLSNRVAQNVTGHLNLKDITTLAPVSYVEGLPNTDAGGGHGTHCAGIVAGTGAASEGRYEGVAPGARVVGFSSGATLAILNTLGGFDYAVANRDRYQIKVITNSWGDTSDTGDFNPDDPVNVTSKLCNDRNILVVFSAGNAGPGAGTISGNYKKAPWVVTVAAGTKSRQLASFSSRGVKDKTVTVRGRDGVTYVSEDRPTVTAPGAGIVSARAAGSSLSPLSAPADATGVPPAYLPYYTTMDGTSMAAPHVAGIAALMLDMNPALRPYDIKQYLQQSADPMAGYEPWQVGAGYVNAYNAVLQSVPVNPVDAQTTTNPNARVTVAVIDSAINPYHDFYHAGGEIYRNATPSSVTPEVLAAFGIDEAHQIQLTRTGNFAADYAADKARVWDKIRPGELYWFKGTNVIAASYDGGTRPILPDNVDDTHGVGTSSAVLRANPEAVVVFLEGITSDAESFAFRHPEIDIITTSYGPVGSIPLPNHINDSYVGVVFNGKLHFGAADNSPSPAVQDSTAGPWWSVGVAGFQEATIGTTPADRGSEGRQILSGSLPDFVADFTQVLPYCFDCESGMQSASGTSFATPRSEGTMSKILLETRRALGHAGGIGRTETGRPFMAGNAARRITNWELRRALENGAYYPRVMDYTVTTTGTYNLTSVPVLDPAPWSQVGWGAITPDPAHGVVEQTLAHLGIRYAVTRYKDYAACQYMTTLIRARQVYWNAVALESQSRLNFNDPYIYCGQ